MYVAKYTRDGVKWNVSIYEKVWSSEMNSHQITEIARKNFFFHSSGYRWINKEIARHLFTQHELEIVNG